MDQQNRIYAKNTENPLFYSFANKQILNGLNKS